MDRARPKALYIVGHNGNIDPPPIRGSSSEFGQDATIAAVASPMWLDTCESARVMIERALALPDNRQMDAIMASTSTVAVEGSGPLTLTKSTSTDIVQYANRVASYLMGRGDKGTLRGELSTGTALYLPQQKRGIMSEVKTPFIFEAFQSIEEVRRYFRYVFQLAMVQGQAILPMLDRNNNHMDSQIAGELGRIIRNYGPLRKDFDIGENDEIQAGIEASQQFAGGIYFPALVAMKKLKMQGGKSLKQMSDEDVGRFINITNDDVSWLNNVLMAILNAVPIPCEIIYENEKWKRVYMEGRKQAYPLHAFLHFEQEQLKRSVKEIWEDDTLPPKTRRKLVLQRLGIEMSPHIFIPKDVFAQDGVQILQELSAMWQMNVGASSHYLKEPPLSRTPSFKFTRDASIDVLRQETTDYLHKLDHFDRASATPQDMIELYPSVWDDPKKIVGGVTRFDTRPQMGNDQTASNWLIEMQRGVWPRGLDPSKGEFVTFRHMPRLSITTDVWVQVGTNTGIERKELNATDRAILPISETNALRYTQSFAVRDAVRRIMDLRGNDGPIGLEWRYYEPDGRILAIDFSEPLDATQINK